jgi:hypothetical protein
MLLAGTPHAAEAGAGRPGLEPVTSVRPGRGVSESRSVAAVLYSNTIETTYSFNPGGEYEGALDRAYDARRVAFDDIPIPNECLGAATSVEIKKITVGIRRQNLAPATDVDIYVASVTTGPTPPDTELDSPGVKVGTVSLPENGTTAVTVPVSVGTGATTLINVPLNSTLEPGYGFIAMGVRFSDPFEGNAWRLSTGPDANADVIWEYDPFLTAHPNPESHFTFGTVLTVFYVEIEGTPFPNVGVEEPLSPRSLELAAPWPNPARYQAHARFRLPAAAEVRAEVFDMAGRRVATLIDGQPFAAGEHQVSWEGRDASGRQVSAGIYQIRVTAGGAQVARKIVLAE